MNRTQDEIVERIKLKKEDDLFGFEVSEYISYLDYDHAKEFITKNTSADAWDKITAGAKERNPVDIMRDYMPFAWEKANNRRGVSANRSIGHFIAWLWLAGEDSNCREIEEDYERRYCYYGKLILAKICERFEFANLDNGERVN